MYRWLISSLGRVIIVFTCISYVIFVLYYTHVLLIYVLTVIGFFVYYKCSEDGGPDPYINETYQHKQHNCSLDQILAILFAINIMHIWNIL